MSLYYEVIGEGTPVVLIHGFTVDHKLMAGCMEPVFNQVSGYKRIYIDLPGMGMSNNITDINTTDKILDSLINLINKIIPKENFLLIGESYGGYLVRGIAAKLKARTNAIGFICPVIVPEKSKRNNLPQHEILESDNKFLKTLDEETRMVFTECNVILTEYVFNRFKEEVLSGIKKSNREVITQISQNYSLSIDPDSISFNKPAIFYLGKHDSVVGYSDALGILNSYPKADVILLENAGHNLQIEQQEVFTTSFVQWLKQI